MTKKVLHSCIICVIVVLFFAWSITGRHTFRQRYAPSNMRDFIQSALQKQHGALKANNSDKVHSPTLIANNTTTITIGWVGDMVPSDNALYNARVFDSVRDALQTPDLMIANLEGTFAQPEKTEQQNRSDQPDKLDQASNTPTNIPIKTVSKCRFILRNCHAFRGDSSFAQSIKDSGIDMVSLVNNHSYDFGVLGLQQTTDVLQQYDIPYITTPQPTIQRIVNGVRIGILGLSSTPPTHTITDYNFITKRVQHLKKENDIVIVIFHGGAEGSNKTTVPYTTEYMGTENRGDVAKVAHTAIDAGATLVLGSGPHVLRPVEQYKDGAIAYSLGNFVGGKGKLQTAGALGTSGIFTATLSISPSMTPTDTITAPGSTSKNDSTQHMPHNTVKTKRSVTILQSAIIPVTLSIDGVPTML